MIVQLRLEVSERQRGILARLNTPKAKRRLATRAEVTELLEGFLAAYTEEAESLPDSAASVLPESESTGPRLSAESQEQKLAAKLDEYRRKGWSQDKLDSYARAWRRVG